MRKIAIVALALAACLAQAQFKYDVFVQGSKIGTATVIEQVNSKGKTEKLHLSVTQAGQMVTMSNASSFDAKGIQRTESMVVAAKEMSRAIAASYNGGTVVVSTRNNGAKPAATTVKAPKGSKLADPSEYWFMTFKPKVGAVAKATKFNIQTMTWEDTVSTYVGDAQVTVSGKKVKGHKVTTVHGGATGTVVLDDKGHILTYEEAGMRLERTN